MKHRNLILLAVLLALVGAFFLLRDRQPTEKQLRVFDADSTQVGSFEISTVTDTVVVTKIGNGWMLTYPEKWAVEEQRLRYFFEQVLPATYSGMPMGEGANAVNIYDLSADKALQIKVYSKEGRVLKHAYFGNTGNPFDYFRFEGENKVYQVKQQIVGRIQPELPNWRSPHVVALSPERLERISVKHIRNSYVLTRQFNAWYYRDSREEFRIPDYNVTMGKILNILGNLQAYNTIGSSAEQVKTYSNDCEVDITLTDGSQKRLDFLRDGEKVYLMVDRDPATLFVVVMDTMHRFMRHAAVFNIQEWGS